MSISHGLQSARLALTTSIAAALLTGCSGASMAPTPAQPATALSPAGTQLPPGRTLAHASKYRSGELSWMSPDAKRRDLLYVSDLGTGDVDVYSYPKAHLVGMLSGFIDPGGLCTDGQGDVFITDEIVHRVFEYAHGGTNPIATLNAPGRLVVACSVDPTTGNVAVNTADAPGVMLVFTKDSPAPTVYAPLGGDFAYPPAYDNAGNLFFEAATSTRHHTQRTALAELAAGSTKLTQVSLSQKIHYPSTVAWDGQYLAVGDANYLNHHVAQAGVLGMYRVQIAGTQGTVVGSAELLPASGCKDSSVVTFSLVTGSKSSVATKVIAGAENCSVVELWKYPGAHEVSRTIAGFEEPLGAVISAAP